MGRLTVRLPNTLHQQLVKQAENEKVSLNHYLVFCLTRISMADEVKQQQHEFDRVLTKYPEKEAEDALFSLLEEREEDPNLDIALKSQIASKIAKKSNAKSKS